MPFYVDLFSVEHSVWGNGSGNPSFPFESDGQCVFLHLEFWEMFSDDVLFEAVWGLVNIVEYTVYSTRFTNRRVGGLFHCLRI